MAKKVLMLVSNEFNPDVRVDKEARALSEKGYDVTVAAWDRYLRKPRLESLDGYSIVRLRTGRIDRKWLLPLGFPWFFLSSLRLVLREMPDVIHCHDLDTLPQGALAAKLLNVPLVYDAHEHYAAMIEQDLPVSVASMADRVESALVKNADLVVAANDPIAEYLSQFSKKVVVVMNCIDPVPRELAPPRSPDGKVVLLYAGVLEPLRYIEEVVSAVKGMKEVELRIAGTGTLQDQVAAAAKESVNIVYLGRLPRDQTLKEMGAADAVIALLDPSNENNRIGTPNRLFEAMAVGRPALVSKGTLSGKMVEEIGCGAAIDWSPDAFRAFAAELQEGQTAREWGEQGRAAAEKSYNWSAMKARLVKAYGEIPLAR
jgi:glycosyltransferase involved in cell wall biosynthesis